MERGGRLTTLVLLTLVAVVGPARAQTNMLSPTNPIILTADDVPDGGTGDSPVTVTHLASTLTFNTCDGPISVETFTDGGIVMAFGPGGGTPWMTVTGVDSSDAHARPIVWEFDEQAGGFNTATFTFIDTDGDHGYEFIQLVGDASGNPVAFDINFLFHDSNGDGFPEYVTFDFAALPSPFDNPILVSCAGTDYTKAWFPVAHDLQNDPAVILDLDGVLGADGQFLWGPKFEGPVSFVEVPTLSRLSIAVFAFLLLFAGLWLARRHGRGLPARGA